MSDNISLFPPPSGGAGIECLFQAIRDALEESRQNHSDSQKYLFALNPILSDVQGVKRSAAQLVLSGANRNYFLGILFQEGWEGELSASLISKELNFPVHSLFLDKELLVQAENQGRKIYNLSINSNFAKEIRRLAKKINQAFLNDALSNKDAAHPQETNLLDFEEAVSSRVWKALSEVDLSSSVIARPVESIIEREIQSLLMESPGFSLSADVVQLLRERLIHQLMGWGPLQDLISDPEVSEVMVNGPEKIYVERRGRIEKVEKKFMNEAQLRLVIERMVGGAGRRVDTASPLCDLRLPEGGRVNVVLAPLSLNGPVLTIRRFRPAFGCMSDLIRAGTLSGDQAEILSRAVRDRQNIVIAGNSASGKTTLMNLLSCHMAEEERIITIEDAAELDLQKPHVVRLETRRKNMEGIGEINMSDLVVNALRMRPDRLMIGECRGAEAIPMLQAMNTGHDGSMTTLHANSAADAIHRLEAMVLLGAPHWPLTVIRQQIASAIDLVVYLKRTGADRKCEEINQLHVNGTNIALHPVYHPGESQ